MYCITVYIVCPEQSFFLNTVFRTIAHFDNALTILKKP